jgi:hypothetical protein
MIQERCNIGESCARRIWLSLSRQPGMKTLKVRRSDRRIVNVIRRL